VKKLLIYPPGRGGIAINANDYACLGSGMWLNDVIIAFYLKYIHNELLSEDQRAKTHIFSQFFYSRLTTTMTKEKDPNLTAAQKRHARVATWTKDVNLFEKDFVIIPINHNKNHWFLAIVCFPNLTEPHTMDTYN
jgi:sentrin-specific protease 7